MAYKKITGRQRDMINNLRDRAWDSGLTDATFSQIAKNPADWERQVAQAEQSKEEAASEAAKAAKQITAEDATTIITRLRAAGLTIRQIAIQAGVHTSTVYRWARGLFAPIASRYASLATLAASTRI